jgi:hypothetical protein
LSSLSVFADESLTVLKINSEIDYAAIVNKETNEVNLFFIDDAVTYDTVSVFQLVEYAFLNGFLISFFVLLSVLVSIFKFI